MKATIYDKRQGVDVYLVTGVTTETEEQIIDFCDPNNWGGYTTKTDKGVLATIYID